MRQYFPRNEQLLSWDPENMERYWELCESYDKPVELDLQSSEVSSQKAFSRLFCQQKEHH